MSSFGETTRLFPICYVNYPALPNWIDMMILSSESGSIASGRITVSVSPFITATNVGSSSEKTGGPMFPLTVRPTPTTSPIPLGMNPYIFSLNYPLRVFGSTVIALYETFAIIAY